MHETHDKLGPDNHSIGHNLITDPSICHVEQPSHLLNDESSLQEALTIIRSLIDRIEITPGEKRVDTQVHLVGGLAAILGLAVSGQQKTAIRTDSGVGRVFMVAGAGFFHEPTIRMQV